MQAAKMEADRTKRLQEKKKRDQQRKDDEERKKKEEDEARRLTETTIASSSNKTIPANAISPVTSPIDTDSFNNPQTEINPSDGNSYIPEGELRSPPKQKQKRTKPDAPAVTIFLRPALKDHNKDKRLINSHAFKHKRVILEASIKLSDDNPFAEFIARLQDLLKNGQLVDPNFSFSPIKVNGKDNLVHDPATVPTNMTLLGAYINISRSFRNPFEKQKVVSKSSGSNKKKEEFNDPIVYFSLAAAMDENPEELISRIQLEWSKKGGIKLEVKGLQSLESETILMLFNVYTLTPQKILLDELKMILTEAQTMAQLIDRDEFRWDRDNLPEHSSIPDIDFRSLIPRLPGQDVSHLGKLSWQVQNNKKVLHVECDKHFSSDMKRLTQFTKEYGLVKRYWGRHAHISEILSKDSSHCEARRLAQVAHLHSNYQCSMILEDIQGIASLDSIAEAFDEDGASMGIVSLRGLMLKHLRLNDGMQLIAEIHQASGPMGKVFAVIPQHPEAERMVAMMNKNIAAYLINVFQDRGFESSFVRGLVKTSCDTTLFFHADACTWNRETGVLTTPQEKESANAEKDLASASWYRDAFAGLDLSGGPKAKKQPPPPDAMFDIDGRSMGTIHEKHQKRQEAEMHTPPRKAKVGFVDLADDDSNEDSASSFRITRPRPTKTAGDEDGSSSASSDEESGDSSEVVGGE